ncbi:MAG: hypothetical protein RR178_10770 [Gordonibacter sp.]
MSIFVSHTSALEFWRAHSLEDVRASRAMPQPGDVPEKSVLADFDFAEYGIVSQPLHLMVSDAASRGQSKQVVCHTWIKARVAGSFVCVSDSLYVSSPEACFLQVARQLSGIELVAVGLEFCGTYALCGSAVRGFRERPPLTTVGLLRKYLSKAAGGYGVANAEKALRYIAEASASPMETMLVMLLCLPCALGGYGLELPVLNHRIKVPASGMGRRRSYCCDLFWPRAKLAVEYDSDMFHTDSKRIANDSQRRAELLRLGVSVVSITRRQVFDARAFDDAAHTVAKSLGKRLRSIRTDVLTRRYDLRKHLIEKMRSPGSSKGEWLRGDYVDW